MNTGFVIFARKTKSGKVTYYARLKDTDGRIIRTVATGLSNRTAATRYAVEIVRQGVVSNGKNQNALEYFLAFWSPTGDYAEGKAARGQGLSINHLLKSRRAIERDFAPYLAANRVMDLTPGIIERGCLDLRNKGKNARTINVVLVAIKTAYAEFCRLNHTANILAGVRKFAENPKEKGILSLDEIKTLVAVPEAPRIRAAVLLATLCGLRVGECRGLQFDDYDNTNKLLRVVHNVVEGEDKVKGPKCGSFRTVPVPLPVAEAIEACRSPAGTSPFVLFNRDRDDWPMEYRSIVRGFMRMMAAIGIDEKTCKSRNLTFHGLRHTFVSMARHTGLPDHIVQKLSGHKSLVMLQHYGNHDRMIDFNAAKEAMEKAVGQ